MLCSDYDYGVREMYQSNWEKLYLAINWAIWSLKFMWSKYQLVKSNALALKGDGLLHITPKTYALGMLHTCVLDRLNRAMCVFVYKSQGIWQKGPYIHTYFHTIQWWETTVSLHIIKHCITLLYSDLWWHTVLVQRSPRCLFINAKKWFPTPSNAIVLREAVSRGNTCTPYNVISLDR